MISQNLVTYQNELLNFIKQNYQTFTEEDISRSFKGLLMQIDRSLDKFVEMGGSS